MWGLLRQRWSVLPDDWKLAFIVLVLSSVVFPALWQLILLAIRTPNRVYKRTLIKMHDARTEWFAIHGGQAGAPSEDDVIKLSGVRPWLAKRALRIQAEKLITGDFKD